MATTKLDDLVAMASTPSQKPKKEEKKDEPREVAPITQGSTKESSATRKFKNSEAGERSHEAGRYFLKDILIPSLLDILCDGGKGIIEILCYGSTRGAKAKTSSSYVSYGSNFKSRLSSSSEREPRRRTSRDIGEVIVETRSEAEDVMTEMERILKRYGSITVADLFTLTRIDPSLSDRNWGWYSLDRARVTKVREGWAIDMPMPEPIDD